MWLCENAVFLLKLYYSLNNTLFSDQRSGILKKYSKRHKNFYVLQIGANDGFDNDPVHKFIMRYGWSGLLIEPQPKVFNNYLVRTYSRVPQINLANVALSSEIGTKSLYCLSFSDHRWATGLSRFDKNTFQGLIDNGYIERQAKMQGVVLPESPNDYFTKMEVQTVNFDYLIEKYEIEKIDLLQIDTEGYDFEILKLFPFQRLKPKFINLEYSHFDDKTKQACQSLLSSNKYEYTEIVNDLFCVLKE